MMNEKIDVTGGGFAFGEDFLPCRLQASLTRSTAQMRALRHSSLGENHLPLYQIKRTPAWCPFYLAQREGFEPSCGVIHKLISSQPRYDRFDTSA